MKNEGPSVDKTLRCFGCDYFDVWWNGGPNLHAKCKEVDKYIPGDHKPGCAGDIKTPGWCSFKIREIEKTTKSNQSLHMTAKSAACEFRRYILSNKIGGLNGN